MMENIEDKLNNYRLRKKRKEKLRHLKNNMTVFLMFGIKDNNANTQPDETAITIHEQENVLLKRINNSIDAETNGNSYSIVTSAEGLTNKTSSETIVFKYILPIICIIFWATLYIIAIELQFGTVFLTSSALIAIYLNTRTGSKKYDEVSAYSIFNKNCESIDGTLKAEQLEREIGIR